MKKIKEITKNKAGRWIWAITMTKGKTRKILAQSGKGTDYSTRNGAQMALVGLKKTLNEIV